MKSDWNTVDRIFYAVMCSGMMIWAVAQVIEACRSRPKVQMLVLSVKSPAKPEPDESSSATE